MTWFDITFYELFPQIFNMSITGTIIILAVIFVRFLLKKAPKIFSYALWAAVLFRLLCPVSFSLDISFLNQFDVPVTESGSIEYVPANIVHMVEPSISTPIAVVNDVVNESLPQGDEQLVADALESPMSIITYIWFWGIAALVIYSTFQYIKLRKRLIGATTLCGNVFMADHIDSPFVIGLVCPKIYLPSSLSETEQEYVILHEKHHVKRGDHIIKILAFATLCVHWFNPFVWLAFVLSGKDMEMSCDEAVMSKMDYDIRAEYATSLLRFATGRKLLVGTPLAFGEGDTKDRVKNVMTYKKPLLWLSVTAGVVIVVAVVIFMANPTKNYESSDVKVASYGKGVLGAVKSLDLTDSDYLVNLIGTADWTEGTADCINDCVIYLPDEKILFYHSGCGTINDKLTQKSFRLNVNEQDKLNSILEEYMNFSTGNIRFDERIFLNIPEGAVKLNQEEIQYFQTQFFSNFLENTLKMENMFLTSTYSIAEEIDLYKLFCNGIHVTSQITDEEKETLKRYLKAEEVDRKDIIRISMPQMDELLNKYIGLTLETTQRNGLEQFTYLEEYDAYYLKHEDANYKLVEISDGFRTEDGQIVLLYYDIIKLYDDSYMLKDQYIVTLQPRGKGSNLSYQFVSNLRVEN